MKIVFLDKGMTGDAASGIIRTPIDNIHLTWLDGWATS